MIGYRTLIGVAWLSMAYGVACWAASYVGPDLAAVLISDAKEVAVVGMIVVGGKSAITALGKKLGV